MYAAAQQKQGAILGAGSSIGPQQVIGPVGYNSALAREPARVTPEIPREQQFLMQELSLLEKVTGEVLEKLSPVRGHPRPTQDTESSLPECATEVGSAIRTANMHAAAVRRRLETLLEELAV